jgi:hypothetical protein
MEDEERFIAQRTRDAEEYKRGPKGPLLQILGANRARPWLQLAASWSAACCAPKSDTEEGANAGGASPSRTMWPSGENQYL